MGKLRKFKKLVGVAQENKDTIAKNVDKRSGRFEKEDVEKAVDKAADVAGESGSDGSDRT